MRILLLGEYSNVHATLADGLRQLGHVVTVASDGDNWKNYRRDVDLKRVDNGPVSTLRFLFRLKKAFRSFKGYDVVQIINPVFIALKAERIWPYYRYLRRHNKAVFLGAFGMDYYYAKVALDCKTFRYSDFNLGKEVRHCEQNDIWIHDWLKGEKGRLNRYIAADCDGIIAGLYEYFVPYNMEFKDKLTFIPFPIHCDTKTKTLQRSQHEKVRFFIGIQRARTAYKGTDIMLKALERVVHDFPDDCEMVMVESVPFAEYQKLLDGSDVILDQLYSYTPAMNALEAMSKGLIVVGGGEPENYEILNETQLRPLINVEPSEESVYEALCNLVRNRHTIPQLSADSIAYVKIHHDSKLVAQRYVDFWQSRSEQ